VMAAQLAKAANGMIVDDDPVRVAVCSAVALHALAGEQSGWYKASGLADQLAVLRQMLER